MLDWFKTRLFRGKVFMRIEELCLSTLGTEDGGYAMSVFARLTRHLEESGTIQTDATMSAYRRRSFSVDEAAISFVDGTVTQLKRLSDGRELPKEVTDTVAKGIALLEAVIDGMMRDSPGRILPRNGKFAHAMESVGIDRFFTDTF